MLQRHDHLMVQLLLLAAAASVGANAVAAVAGGAAAASAGSGRPSESEPAPYIIDVADTFGAITFETLVNATAAGIAALGKHTYVTVKISAGTHVIDCQGDLFTVEGVQTQGEFAIEGAGMEQTVLLLKQGMHNMIKGDSFQNIAWRDLTFSHTTGQTTRGKVVDVSTTSVTLDVPRGFPSPQEILSFRYPRLRPDQGLYLLQYTTTAPGSVRVPAKLTDFPTAVNHTVRSVLPKFNAHLPYTCSLNATPAINTTSQGYVCDAVQDLGDGRWKFEVGSSAWTALRPLYKAAIARQDIVVGVKAKRGGQAYALGNGDGVKFERVVGLAFPVPLIELRLMAGYGVSFRSPVCLRCWRRSDGKGTHGASSRTPIASSSTRQTSPQCHHPPPVAYRTPQLRTVVGLRSRHQETCSCLGTRRSRPATTAWRSSTLRAEW